MMMHCCCHAMPSIAIMSNDAKETEKCGFLKEDAMKRFERFVLSNVFKKS
jgi:hypothetical protein